MRSKVFAVAALLTQGIAMYAQVKENVGMDASPVTMSVKPVYAGQQSDVVPMQEKHKHGDWYLGLGVGVSQCMAENGDADDFFKNVPSFSVMLGHNFSHSFGLRLTGGMNFQKSRCNAALIDTYPEVYGKGKYGFNSWTAQLSGVLNMTNLFFGYDQRRTMTWNILFGGGVLDVYSFERKVVDGWNEQPYYPVDTKGGFYGVGHVGAECLVRASKALDVGVEVRMNVTDNDYNGVSNKNTIDFYMDARLCVAYHLKNGKQGMRRMDVPVGKAYVDPVLAECAVSRPETVAYGEPMNAVVPFYAGFYYLNDATRMRVEQVAKFLKLNPQVALTIVGHPDVVPDGDELYHEHLAQCRADVVKKALVDDFGIEPERLECAVSDKALQSYKAVREWVPAVGFVMRERK